MTATEAPRAELLTPTIRQTARRSVGWLIVGIIAVLVTGLGLLASGTSGPGPSLGAENPAPAGSRAIVEVLRSHGISVVEPTGIRMASTLSTRDTTLLIYDPAGILSAAQLGELRGRAGATVLMQPDFAALSALAPGVHDVGSTSSRATRAAGCAVPAATRAGAVVAPGHAYRLTSTSTSTSNADACFPNAAGDATMVVAGNGTETTTTVIGSTDILSNDGIAASGNAALALNVLGAHPKVVWYLPTEADLQASGPPSLTSLTPAWVTPVVVLLAVAAGFAMIWRGRRFGPLIVERLPVQVRSSETMEGRARLYQRSSARLRALDALRIGSIARMATALRLPRSATVDEVAQAAAELTGKRPDELISLVRDAKPSNDAQLIALSDQLGALEALVNAAAHPAGSERMEP